MADLAIITAVQNEGPYLLDWVAHHRAIGVKKLFVFSFMPTDHTDEILENLAAEGILRHIRLENAQPSPMVAALKAFWDMRERETSEWLLPLDLREFLIIKTGQGHVDALLESHKGGVDAIVLPIKIFGHNNQVAFSEKPLFETHMFSGGYGLQFPYEASFGKMIANNKQVFHGLGFYRAKQKPPSKSRKLNMIGSDGRPLPEFYTQHERRLSIAGLLRDARLATVNYYPLRSIEDYLLNGYYDTQQRKHNDANLKFWIKNNFNNAEEVGIAPQLEALRQEREKLLLISGMKALLQKSIEKHKREIERHLLEPDVLALFGNLVLARNSAPPVDGLAEKLHRLEQEAEDKTFAEEQARIEAAREKRDEKRKRRRKRQKHDKK